MTEQEWLTCTELHIMLDFLRGKASERKLRLFACGCCRRVWNLLREKRSRRAITVAELFADGRVGDQEMIEVRNCYRDASGSTGYVSTEAGETVKANAHHAASGAAWQARMIAFFQGKVGNTDAELTDQDCIRCIAEEESVQCNILRDIVGNAFKPVIFDPSWITSNDAAAVKLAQAIYDDRAFDRLPILADALEEAGCTDAEILNHCRQPGEHVRGCWVVDLLLGRS